MKSTHIVPLVALGLMIFLVMGGDTPPASTSGIAARVKDLGQISPFQPPRVRLEARDPFMTGEQWDTYYRTVLAPKPRPTPKPSVDPKLRKGLPKGVATLASGAGAKASAGGAVPAPKPTPPPIKVTGILMSDNSRTAIINGRIMGEGVTVGAISVSRIELSRVLLKVSGKPMEVKLSLPSRRGRGSRPKTVALRTASPAPGSVSASPSTSAPVSALAPALAGGANPNVLSGQAAALLSSLIAANAANAANAAGATSGAPPGTLPANVRPGPPQDPGTASRP